MTIRIYNGLSLVPNVEGYRFRGILHNGDLIACIVEKNAIGMHFAVEEETRRPCYDDLCGWTPYLSRDHQHFTKPQP